MKFMRNFILIIVFITSIIACCNPIKGDSKEQIESDITVIRFDKDLYSYLQNPTIQKKKELIAAYPSLLPAFGQITVGKMIDKDTAQVFTALLDYFSHPQLNKIYKDELQKFDDISEIEKVLSQANTILKQILPKKKFSKFALHVSGFKENVIVIDGIISLSSDKYLGESYTLYQKFFTPEERCQMSPHLIPRDYIKAWIIADGIVNINEDANLMSNIIKEGKALYLLSKLLASSDYSSKDIIGYTQDQIDWCENNIKEIWKETRKENRLLSTDKQLISRYIDEAPASITVLPKAPKRVGSWLGWKIIEEYALNTGKSVQEILMADSQTIIRDSKFKP